MISEKSGTPLTFRLLAVTMLLIMAAFLMIPLVTAHAATTPPTITVIGVIPGEDVQVSIGNLPADTDFKVTMSAVGHQGVGSVIANFNSHNGETRTYWFEILTTVRSEDKVEIRIDSGAGVSAYTTFDNTKALTSPSATTTASPATTTATPVAVSSPVMGPIHVLHVQQGGIVVAELKNLPLDTVFSVTVGKAGSQGFGGYKVGSLSSEELSDHIGYFEIPVELKNETSLDLRIEARGYLYLVTFNNTNL